MSNIEQLILALVTEHNMNPKDQLNLFNKFVKRLAKYDDMSVVKPCGRKPKSDSHKKRSLKVWQAKKLAEKHAIFFEENGHLPLKGRRPKAKEY